MRNTQVGTSWLFRIVLIVAFMRDKGWEPYPHQREFMVRWIRPPCETYELDWNRVVESMSLWGRASGRTTMLAMLLATDETLPEPWKDWASDHHPTHRATTNMIQRAHMLKDEWNTWRENVLQKKMLYDGLRLEQHGKLII